MWLLYMVRLLVMEVTNLAPEYTALDCTQLKCIALEYCEMQCSAVLFGTGLCSAVEYSVQRSAVQLSAV